MAPISLRQRRNSNNSKKSNVIDNQIEKENCVPYNGMGVCDK